MKQATINVMAGHADYVVKPKIGPEILFHGQIVDLRSLTPKKADQIASDPEARYFVFSAERIQKDRKPASPKENKETTVKKP